MENLKDLLFEYNGGTDLSLLDSLNFLHGFIKWLVENDKIDRNLLDGAILHKTHREFDCDYGVEDMEKQYYEKALMLLSISDTPIDDLISYLK